MRLQSADLKLLSIKFNASGMETRYKALTYKARNSMNLNELEHRAAFEGRGEGVFEVICLRLGAKVSTES